MLTDSLRMIEMKGRDICVYVYLAERGEREREEREAVV